MKQQEKLKLVELIRNNPELPIYTEGIAERSAIKDISLFGIDGIRRWTGEVDKGYLDKVFKCPVTHDTYYYSYDISDMRKLLDLVYGFEFMDCLLTGDDVRKAYDGLEWKDVIVIAEIGVDGFKREIE